MSLTPIKTPIVVKKMFPKYVWNIDTSLKVIYLTFDDGPTPEITHWVLNTLEQYKAKATFFCIGNNVEKHPEIFQDILKNDHAIGNHTHNHLKGWKHKTKAYLKNIELCESVLNLQTVNCKLFRPPYGQIKPKQGKKLLELDYKIVMWDVLSFDWDKNISEKKCLTNVITKANKGSIIVFHDSLKASKNMMYALPKVLEYFSKKGYAFKKIDY